MSTMIRILETIKQNPGITGKQICRMLDINKNQLYNSGSRLEGRIRKEKSREFSINVVKYYLSGETSPVIDDSKFQALKDVLETANQEISSLREEIIETQLERDTLQGLLDRSSESAIPLWEQVMFELNKQKHPAHKQIVKYKKVNHYRSFFEIIIGIL